MKTITIQIGNTDDKLTQTEWSNFVNEIDKAILTQCKETHFFGASPNYQPWQNAAWVISCEEARSDFLRTEARRIRKLFKQDSVAWTEGETEFV